VSETDDPTDPLAVLGHELRIAILRELAAADEPLPFSTLRERVGERDPGRFNYHLTELCRHFVRETGEGYELGPAGSRVIDVADRAGDAAGRPVDATLAAVEDDCPVCGDPDCERLFHVHLTPR
jgi:DNA-binding transcriptional ArsR family regulator